MRISGPWCEWGKRARKTFFHYPSGTFPFGFARFKQFSAEWKTEDERSLLDLLEEPGFKEAGWSRGMLKCSQENTISLKPIGASATDCESVDWQLAWRGSSMELVYPILGHTFFPVMVGGYAHRDGGGECRDLHCAHPFAP